MHSISRRAFLHAGTSLTAASLLGLAGPAAMAFVPSPPELPSGDRPPQDPSVRLLHPRNRVPLSFIIDDSTCLVNMGMYCMGQFNAAWPQNPIYWRKWKDWPREIPDSFVRTFGEFCAEQGVRGKYSIVPYPACVGWLDRDLPGWSKKELKDSLQLVRDLMVPRWDITPEMITHTRMIDIKTGRPIEPAGPTTMENSWPPEKKSVDEMAAYMAYALQILKNAELPCEGITTPGGFGNKCKNELSLGIGQAVSDVFGAEIPHYFKYIAEGNESTLPRLENVVGAHTDRPRFVANVPAGTGDWFGGWDGDRPPQGFKYSNDDATAGRMVELIERNEPSVMFCHWAGLYSHGTLAGFEACKKVILAVNGRFGDRTIWMKTSEMARYQAARELTRIERAGNDITLTAPFACPAYTLSVKADGEARPPTLLHEGKPIALEEAKDAKSLKAGNWMKQANNVIVCFDLPKGAVTMKI